jgi:hypothetical protein
VLTTMNADRGIPRGFAALHTPAGYARRSAKIMKRILLMCCSLLIVGCEASSPKPATSARSIPPLSLQLEGDAVPVGRIPWAQALKIAHRQLSQDAVAAPLFDQRRYFLRYHAKSDSYTIDFGRRNHKRFLAHRWEHGYLVVVDAKTGFVKEANGYKR